MNIYSIVFLFVICVSVGVPLPFVLIAFIASFASNWNYYIVTSSNVW